MKETNFTLNILNENEYKIYVFESKINPETNETYQPTSYDIHIWKIMTENFLENCKNNNIKFAFIFNLHTITTLPLNFIIDICGFFMNYNAFFKDNLIANCFIFSNDRIKSFIDLFLKYYKPVKPIQYSNNIEECRNSINVQYNKNKSREIREVVW